MAELYKVIGRGTFGVVFATDESDTAVKKTFKNSDTLAVEFEHGLAASFALNNCSSNSQLYVPRAGSSNTLVPVEPWYAKALSQGPFVDCEPGPLSIHEW